MMHMGECMILRPYVRGLIDLGARFRRLVPWLSWEGERGRPRDAELVRAGLPGAFLDVSKAIGSEARRELLE